MTLDKDVNKEYKRRLTPGQKEVLTKINFPMDILDRNSRLIGNIQSLAKVVKGIYNRRNDINAIKKDDGIGFDIMYGRQKRWEFSFPESFNQRDSNLLIISIISLALDVQGGHINPESINVKIEGIGISIGYGYKKEGGTREILIPYLGDCSENLQLKDKISNIFDFVYSESKRELSSLFSFVGAGCSSIIIRYGKEAFKFTTAPKKEYNLLMKLFDKNTFNKNPSNVIKLVIGASFGEPCYSTESTNYITLSPSFKRYFKVEYISGENVETLLKSRGNFTSEEVLRYSRDIVNGMIELRQVGIYHRDLHPGNIMINDEGRAIIIDLHAATKNPNAIYKRNRAYGGNNDLVSLGLLMYKMATGNNLFSDETGMTVYRKDNVKVERERAYADLELKQSYLNKVRADIKDKNLADMVITLLDDDLWKQPSIEKVYRAQKMLDRYSK